MRARPRVLALCGLLPFLCAFDPLHGPNRDVEEGNRQLGAGHPDLALKAYQRAAHSLGDDPGLSFDEGTALLALKRLAGAQSAFQHCAAIASDPALEASAFYDLGNTFYAEKKYKDSVGAYIRTLRLDPSDRRAKWNLELALRAEKADEERKKKQQQHHQSPSSQPSGGHGPRNPASQPGSQPSSRPSARDGAKKPPQGPPASRPSQPRPSRSRASAPPPSDLTKEKVDRLLDSVDHSYKNFAAMQGASGPEPQPEKDW